MKTDHLSDMQIQQYALDKSSCENGVIEHIGACERCIAEAAIYHALFSGIKEQQEPAFDFDLAAAVLARLQPGKPRFSTDGIFFYVLAGIISCSVCIPAYLFRKYIANMFSGISVFLTYTILTVAVFIIMIQCVEMYRKYQKQMNALN